MLKKEFPQIHYYDQDFVDIYDRTWAWMSDFWHKAEPSTGIENPFYAYDKEQTLSLFENCIASFFLVYYSKKYPVSLMLDNFYELQEESGAIRGHYDLQTGKPVTTDTNPEGLSPPMLAWAEYNLYHKVGAKKRVKEVIPALMKYHDWLEANFKEENGLYAPPREVSLMENGTGDKVKYPIDFNVQMALNALCMASLGDILNNKEINFRYKHQFFSLKTRINSQMWNPDDKIYYDLDAKGKQVKRKTISAFWPLLAEIPNEERAEGLFGHLKNPETFGTENPFPTLAANEKDFDEEGGGVRGAVIPFFTYMVIKGLEKYKQYEFAREVAIRHMYFVVDTFHPDGNKKGSLWRAYKPLREGPAVWKERPDWNRRLDLAFAGLTTVTLMIENVVGLLVSLPRKTVDWFVPTMEIMGIEELSLKRNRITIISNKSSRGWEIRLESEKLYYFSIHLLNEGKKKTLPMPSGKCSMLVDKL